MIPISIGTKNLFSDSFKKNYKEVSKLKKVLLSLILVSSLVFMTGCAQSRKVKRTKYPKQTKQKNYTKPKKHINGLSIYKVQRGDSLSGIAKKHKMDFNKFLRVNRLTARSTIYPGQQLYIEPNSELRKRFMSY